MDDDELVVRMNDELVVRLDQNEARVNVTYAGGNGELPDAVNKDALDGDIKQWVTEAVRGGGIPGIPASPQADFTDFVIDRFPPNDQAPYNRIFLRPKVPFGRSKYITVVGVGALGSHVIQFLRNQDAVIVAIDFDRIEQKNTAAQFHAKNNVGKLKVNSIQQTMSFLWGTRVTAFPSKLTTDNAIILGEVEDNLIVDCLDNGASRRVAQAHVRRHGFACVHGALAADGAYGRVVWDENFIIDDESSAGEPTCDGGEHLPFIGLVSTLLAQAVQEWCKGGKHIGFSISPGGVIKI